MLGLQFSAHIVHSNAHALSSDGWSLSILGDGAGTARYNPAWWSVASLPGAVIGRPPVCV